MIEKEELLPAPAFNPLLAIVRAGEEALEHDEEVSLLAIRARVGFGFNEIRRRLA